MWDDPEAIGGTGADDSEEGVTGAGDGVGALGFVCGGLSVWLSRISFLNKCAYG